MNIFNFNYNNTANYFMGGFNNKYMDALSLISNNDYTSQDNEIIIDNNSNFYLFLTNTVLSNINIASFVRVGKMIKSEEFNKFLNGISKKRYNLQVLIEGEENEETKKKETKKGRNWGIGKQ